MFFTCEPGGAEVLSPIIDLINTKRDFKSYVYCYGYACDIFNRNNIQYNKIYPIGLKSSLPITPDLIISSAASYPFKDMSEKYLWNIANNNKIPSIAILDQWQNYSIRFSGIQKEDQLNYLPTKIACIDNIAKKEMIAEGFPEDILLPLGHPYLSSFKEQYNESLPILSKLREKIDFNNEDKFILFISEPIKEYYGNSRGYTQYDALQLFLEYVRSAIPNKNIIIKLHPKEQESNYTDIIKNKLDLKIKLVSNLLSPVECISLAENAFGMSSIMLIQAYILNKPVISIQPNLKIIDPFVLTRSKTIPLVKSSRDFKLCGNLNENKYSLNIKFHENKFLKLLNDLM